MKKLDIAVLLSFTAAFVDTASFLGREGLFTAHVTGNFVTLVLALPRSAGAQSRRNAHTSELAGSRNGKYGIFGRYCPTQSGLMPPNLTTLRHFSVSSAMNLPKSAGEPVNTVAPWSA